MSIKIVAVCDDSISGELLQKSGEDLGIVVNYEIQNKKGIINKLSNKLISESDVVLFVTEKEVEQIEEIERFIDREYYEVHPQFVISDAKNVISEITMDFN